VTILFECSLLFSSRVRAWVTVSIRVRIRFSVWLGSCYAHAFVQLYGCDCHTPIISLESFFARKKIEIQRMQPCILIKNTSAAGDTKSAREIIKFNSKIKIVLL